jgi:RNA polymerase sigma factor (sigma-70 family)
VTNEEVITIDGSFEEFVHGHIGSLRRQASVLTGERHAAEDLVQETLIRVAGAWRRMREDGNPVAYANTVMFRAYVSSWRALRRRPRTVELISEPHAAGDDYATVDNRLLLRQALGKLPRLQRAVLVATYLHDATDDQISVLIARAPSTVRTLRRRGLAALSAAMGEDYEPVGTGPTITGTKGVQHGEPGISAP